MGKVRHEVKYGGAKEIATHAAPAKDARSILIKVPKLRKIKPPKPGRG
jgi:hypothetical protein